MKTLERKQEIIKIAKEHRAADRFIQGQWLNGKVKGKYSGCFMGCMTQEDSSDSLNQASEEFDIPLWLVHVAEKIFEGLPQEEAVEFPVQLLEAQPCRLNSDKAYKKFMYTMLMDKDMGQITFTKKGTDQYKAIKQCAALFLMDEIDESAAESAAESARSAESAVWSAAESARSAAESAAWSAAESARSAAWSAAWSAAESAVWSAESARSAESAVKLNYYSWMRDTLINSLKN